MSRALIAQSGGPTAVINASLCGAISTAINSYSREIKEFWGAKNAVEGIVNERFINLYLQGNSTLRLVAKTPGAALGSSREKIGNEKGEIPEEKVFDAIKRNNIRYFFYIGGNDSADNAFTIDKIAKRENYDITVIHIPKTIDNDLRENDHTPGYGSAATYVAAVFLGDNFDNLSLPGVKINVVMGREAGFLTAASALGRRREREGPHLIYTPEIVFDRARFLGDLEENLKRYGRVVVAVSEGIEDEKKVPLGWDGKRFDSHGNKVLSGEIVAKNLTKLVTDSDLTKRVRADVLGSFQRSFPLAFSQKDRVEAWKVGAKAVALAVEGHESCSVAILRNYQIEKEKGIYEVRFSPVALEKVARLTRKMPREFINGAGNNITKEFLDYAFPLIGNLSEVGRLKEIPVV